MILDNADNIINSFQTYETDLLYNQETKQIKVP